MEGNLLMDKEVKFHWNTMHLSVVRSYASSFLQSEFEALNYANFFGDPLWFAAPGSFTVHAKRVASFAQDLQVFFRVPRQHQLVDCDNALTKNDLLASFINFLLQLLHYKTDFTDLFKDRVNTIEKELRYLLTVVGDAIVIDDLLEEFEAVANEVGCLLHSLIFFVEPVFETMEEHLVVVLQHMCLLTDKIPSICQAHITPKSSSVDSLVIVDSLLHDLTDLMNRNDNLIVDVKDLFKYLQQHLIFSIFCIRDIGGLRPSVIGELKYPLLQIGGAACDAQYLINSFLVGDVPLLYFNIRLTHVIERIELIGKGLKEIKKKYNVGASDVVKSFSAEPSLQAKRMSEPEVDGIIVGFDDVEADILDLLVGGTNHLQIISIIGMPGLGKTTLAKKLYNHSLTEYRFDISVWCVVSQTYHRQNLLNEILERLTSGFNERGILNAVPEESPDEIIYKNLKGRRYLIIMDDIWSSNVWDDLRRCFPDDGNGSRILFTSRNKDVAPPTSITYALPSLSNDQCWELLEKKVFHNKPCPTQLIRTGKIIAANCFGLPLAVVAIAGILSTMGKEETTWEEVGGNLASYIYSDQGNPMMRLLELSYEHLSDHLKPCFLYFGVELANEIPVRKLMRLWIAEGFIPKVGRKRLESTAEEYLTELIDKSLVMVSQRRSDGGVKTCVVHDLFRDMCLKISEEENFLRRINHSIYTKGVRILLPRYVRILFGHHVRSFHGNLPETPFYVSNMKLLKVLNFHSMMVDPRLIGTEFLIHLSYLVITDLPASIGSLGNLEFLHVTTSKITVIPPAMVKMKKLRYVNFRGGAYFDEDCDSSRTNNLECIRNIVIRNLKDEEMLKCSVHLRKLKSKCEPTFLVQQGMYRCPDLCSLAELESLNISAILFGLQLPESAEIKLPASIKKLTLSALRLPWDKMSIIGKLPKLEVLKLDFNAFEGETWETKDGEFEQLIFLKLARLRHMRQWNVTSSQHFSKLRKLILVGCDNLQEIPSEVGEVGALQSIELVRCPRSVTESAIKIREEQRELGNEELKVIIKERST